MWGGYGSRLAANQRPQGVPHQHYGLPHHRLNKISHLAGPEVGTVEGRSFFGIAKAQQIKGIYRGRLAQFRQIMPPLIQVRPKAVDQDDGGCIGIRFWRGLQTSTAPATPASTRCADARPGSARWDDCEGWLGRSWEGSWRGQGRWGDRERGRMGGMGSGFG